MAPKKITPKDAESAGQHVEINGHRWHYLDFHPQTSPPKATVILIHGFPDLSLAWRYQIPMLLSLGLRVVALDCMGYGLTGSSPNLKDYTFRTHADAIAGLAKSIGASRVILGGHDWGGMVVYRAAQWYPQLISHVFSVATPYMPVMADKWVSTEELVKGPLPQFGYQLQLGSREHVVEKVVHGEQGVRRWLKGMYGGRSVESKKGMMSPDRGVDLELVGSGEEIGGTPFFDDDELNYYVNHFARNGVEGACNWYRTRRLNWEDDLKLPDEDKKGLRQPVLFIQAANDSILKPEMSVGMEKAIPNLTRGEVKASHWALWHTPVETNELVRNWFEQVVFGGKSKM